MTRPFVFVPVFLLAACCSRIETRATPTAIQGVSGEYQIVIYSPADGEVFRQQPVELRGQASADTVLTVNDESFLLAGGQEFNVPLPLEEGPNAIEIVASDYNGNEIDLILIVTYQPEE